MEKFLCNKTVEWLSSRLSISPVYIRQSANEFQLEAFTRTFLIARGNKFNITAKEQLYENIWGYNYISDAKNLTSFIRKLRKKIEPFPDSPQYVLTVWGVGYKFNEEKA